MKYLGLDVGTKTIGLSIGKPLVRMAFPLNTYKRQNFVKDITYITHLIQSENIIKVIIGLPKNMNGSLGPQSEFVQGFVDKLKESTDVPLIMWDERLSTVAVEKKMIDADVSRKKRKEMVDAQAATFILQGYLDYEHLM